MKRRLSVALVIAFCTTLACFAEPVNLKDQIGMCLTYDFMQEVALEKLVRSADVIESVGPDYVLGALTYTHDLKVSFYVSKQGKAIVYLPKDFNPAIMFVPLKPQPIRDMARNNNLYETLIKLSKIVEIAVDSPPDYCYVPLENCKNFFIRSDRLDLRRLGGLTIKKVFVFRQVHSSNKSDIHINRTPVSLDSASFYKSGSTSYYASYVKDITSYFLKNMKLGKDIEIGASSSCPAHIMIFCTDSQ